MTLMIIRALVKLNEWLDEKKTIEQLSIMSDRELRDMGLTRYDIKYNVKRRNGR